MGSLSYQTSRIYRPADPINSRKAQLIVKNSKILSSSKEVDLETASYKKLAANEKYDPFEFWMQNDKFFKIPAKAFYGISAILASKVESEQLFSAAGII